MEDRGLRDLAIETLWKNVDKLLGHDGFVKLLRQTPEFAADLVPLLCDKVSNKVQRYKCPSCHNRFRADISGEGSYYCMHCSSMHSDWDSYMVYG